MSAFFKQPSRSRLLGTLGTLAVSALVLSACATENPSSDSSSSASASASVSASGHASSAQSSSTSPQVSEHGTAEASSEASGDASPKADAEATSSDGQKLEEIYTGSEEMKKASSVPVDTEEVKKTTELVNSYENIPRKRSSNVFWVLSSRFGIKCGHSSSCNACNRRFSSAFTIEGT